tara:strand:- start:117267 stop:118082 length:816 start_codon:yes stop_codon:yes gene_type:complete
MKKCTTSTAESHGNGNRSETSNVVNSKGSKHDANLRKNGFIHFQIGLIVAMLLVYFGLEYAFNKIQPTITVAPTDTSEIFEYHADANNFEIEKKHVEQKTTEKVTNPDKFIIKPDDFKKIAHSEFKSVPIDENAGVLDVDSIIVPDDPTDGEDIVIPITAVDEVPIFPGCEKVEKSMQRACFEEKMQKHVLRNFRYPDAAIQTQTEGKVYVMFTIGKEGLIEDVQLKGPAKVLENEASRIIDKLPQMKPGLRQLKPVKVSFSLPIVFRLKQ